MTNQELTAESRLRGYIYGYQHSMAIATFTRLGLPDLLEPGPLAAGLLAERSGCNPDYLSRLLEYLCSIEVLKRDEQDRYSLTEISDLLRSKNSRSFNDFAQLPSFDWQWQAWGALPVAIKSGKCPFEIANGKPFFEYLAQNSEANGVFNRIMGDRSEIEAAVAAQLVFNADEVVVDVGGGRGVLAAQLLTQHPGIRPTVFDLPQVRDAAQEYLQAACPNGAIDFVSGSFFSDPIPAADTLVLKWILHDWDDRIAAKILTNCQKALRPGGRLIIVEAIVDNGDAQAASRALDLAMLVVTGGRERTLREFSELLKATGFELRSCEKLRSRYQLSLLEAVV
jgi:SAM-dependent methyltransferase